MFKYEENTQNNNTQNSNMQDNKAEVVELEAIKEEIKDKKEKVEVEVKKPEIKENSTSTNSTNSTKRIFVSDDDNLRRSSLFNAESDLYRVKFDEYAGIPDCIVNQIFGIEDGKGKISVEEAIIMLMNLIPAAKAGINEAKNIQDAIHVSRIKIAAFLYNECTFGFTNIPEHSRVNLSSKIKSDCEKNLVYDVLYDYQLMRLSGLLPLG